MTDDHIPPRVIARKCGGWLAVSGDGGSLRIGVTAPSEAEVKERFWTASEKLKGWIAADEVARLAG